VTEEGESGRIFSSLPLVSGKYMNAPGGHDGRIEIRHSGCDSSPFVLDYREAQRPARIDNKSSCSQPWIDRALALFDIAQKFHEQTKTKEAQTAVADAVQLYDELLMLSSDQNGPLLAPAVIKALATMGVDFSVPQSDLREWLANPLFTPYPAIAQTLLLLGRRLKAPVYLDVIVWNYEHTPGVASPRRVADVKTHVLKAAILEGSNVRYRTNIRDFEQLLQP
jgi:hypothetical protein